eukprot:4210464-Prymnesium_polylepis.1
MVQYLQRADGRRSVIDVRDGRRRAYIMVLSVAHTRACAVRACAWLYFGEHDISRTAESCASSLQRCTLHDRGCAPLMLSLIHI